MVRSGFRDNYSKRRDQASRSSARPGAGREAIDAGRPDRRTGCRADGHPHARNGRDWKRRACLTAPGAEHPRVKVIVITTFDLDEYVFAALRAGAAGFLLKDAQPEVLIDAIHAVTNGFGLIAPEVTGRLIREFAAVSASPDTDHLLDALSTRERDVLLLIAQGKSNAQIAADLFLEESTSQDPRQ